MKAPAARRAYLHTWLALMALLAATTASAYVDLGWGNSALNLGIAAVKAGLIGVYFMHLRSAVSAVKGTVLVALGLLLVMGALSLADLLTR